MFTGIITGVGRIVAVTALGSSSSHGRQLSVQCPEGYTDDIGIGDSIAINGACMTVTRIDAATATLGFDVSAQSLAMTAGLDQTGSVNLEKALRANDRLGGHLVSGHVDGVAAVVHFAPVGESWELRLLIPTALARYLAFKGSITVNGVSLTVNRVSDLATGCEISINLIPHTVHHTALATLSIGARVNLEIDLIARYVERMLGPLPTANQAEKGIE
jgi:riboflavin synthase